MKGFCRYGNLRSCGGSNVLSKPYRAMTGTWLIARCAKTAQGSPSPELKTHQSQIDRYRRR
jgi:hypothetical protein